MGRSSFLKPLLVSMLLLLSFSQGFGRKVMETVELEESTAQLAEIGAGTSSAREMVETMDYQLEPGPNVNPKTGYILTPPPQA